MPYLRHLGLKFLIDPYGCKVITENQWSVALDFGEADLKCEIFCAQSSCCRVASFIGSLPSIRSDPNSFVNEHVRVVNRVV